MGRQVYRHLPTYQVGGLNFVCSSTQDKLKSCKCGASVPCHTWNHRATKPLATSLYVNY